MNCLKYLALGVFLMVNELSEIEAAFGLLYPASRGMIFEKVCPQSDQEDWREYRCGSLNLRDDINFETTPVPGEKCGVCGDAYDDDQPRPLENGGRYGRGLIVETYQAGSNFTVRVGMTIRHSGYYEFSLCSLKNTTDIESEECFDKYKLETVNGSRQTRRRRTEATYDIALIELRLPEKLTCDHCVLRSQYVTIEDRRCDDGTYSYTCGPQSVYRTCSDVKIQ